MAAIPQVQTTDPVTARTVNQLQQNIINAVNPVITNPLTQGTILTGQQLSPGSNTINTGINRTLQGWIIVRQRAAATIFDTQDSNPTPTKTLRLNSSAAVSVDIYVF